ncbi:hypothetical protein SPRG_14785 [Saprolegnia parasitica CBS 223.65]|uniref:Uncharacterized protein n=1 Tax=Saprolegnia parasitica (strain CBS 223.65) TaxID=695850 RepID=A0A067BL66_SAPPC|nr:hypothetical protein SPRG_14785 [Saprolegnia parasitica CBS 223.65]KDO19174.1 hypothetical protein SPRG_14785 [Saprolegnia parasitica CBS 223.65]|eukprot:XP_012210109.1 hypothetical protein SPRG_14785 [Saprolegnia parasitica CBS 223.65]
MPEAASAATWVNALGFSGGVILSICTVPQIYSIVKTKSAGDVSMVFTVMYFFGVATSAAYMFLIDAYAAAWPLAIETIFGASLCFLVYYYTRARRAPYDVIASAHHREADMQHELKLLQASLELAVWFESALRTLEADMGVGLDVTRPPLALTVTFKAPCAMFAQLYPFMVIQAGLARVAIAAPSVSETDLAALLAECRTMGKRSFDAPTSIQVQGSYRQLADAM